MFHAEDGEQYPDFLAALELNGYRHHSSLADYAGQNIWLMARSTEWSLNWRWRYFPTDCFLCALVRIIMTSVYYFPVADL